MIGEVIVLIALLGLLLYTSSRKPSDMPPGTFGWPIVGCLEFLTQSTLVSFGSFKEKYGSICTTKIVSLPTVLLMDYEVIKRALHHPQLQGRPDNYAAAEMHDFKDVGIALTSGKTWQENRQFLIPHLHKLGMCKTRLEVSIQKEAEMLVQHLEQNNLDEPAGIDWGVNVAVVNVIWQMLASKRYDADDEEICEFIRSIDENFDLMQGPILALDYMPILKYFVPRFLKNSIMKVDVILRNRDAFEAYLKKAINEHVTRMDRRDPIDVIDFYLLEIEARKKDPETVFQFNNDNLVYLMGDMFAAGSETTSSTLRWFILFMAINQKIQKKIHKLLDDVVPSSRLPSLDDREELVYLTAAVLDAMRLSSLVPLSIPHQATETILFDGYRIPKGTLILPSFELCHRDARYWKRPNEFYPEHFLDQDGKLDSKKEGYLPFSIGRRRCLGEALARLELFLFASAILQRFTIEAPPGVTLKAETDPHKKLLNVPKPFKVVLRKRKLI